MTTQELVFKKSELQRQVEALKQKIEAIDRVQELFQENALPRARTARYKKMSIAKAIVDFLSRTPGEFMHVADLAAVLKREGIKSKSPNFTTIVSSTCNRLATGKKQKLVRKKMRSGRQAFAIPERLRHKKMSPELQPVGSNGALRF
jgi:hypothetical protein